MTTEPTQSAEERFGAEVRQRRTARGWTQALLVRYSGSTLDQSSMTRLELGKRAIRLNEAAALAGVLGIDLNSYVDTTTQQRMAQQRLTELSRASIDARLALADAIREACPGPHSFVQHRDRRPAWCNACRRTGDGGSVDLGGQE